MGLELVKEAVKQFKTAGDFEKGFEFECRGPDHVGGFSGFFAPAGGTEEKMTVAKCMAFPDCTCPNYRQAIKIMDCLPD